MEYTSDMGDIMLHKHQGYFYTCVLQVSEISLNLLHLCQVLSNQYEII
jgi:hypothetical protein